MERWWWWNEGREKKKRGVCVQPFLNAFLLLFLLSVTKQLHRDQGKGVEVSHCSISPGNPSIANGAWVLCAQAYPREVFFPFLLRLGLQKCKEWGKKWSSSQWRASGGFVRRCAKKKLTQIPPVTTREEPLSSRFTCSALPQKKNCSCTLHSLSYTSSRSRSPYRTHHMLTDIAHPSGDKYRSEGWTFIVRSSSNSYEKSTTDRNAVSIDTIEMYRVFFCFFFSLIF